MGFSSNTISCISLLWNSKTYMTCPSPFLQSSTHTGIFKTASAKSLLLWNDTSTAVHFHKQHSLLEPVGICWAGLTKTLYKFQFEHTSIPPKTTQVISPSYFFFFKCNYFYTGKICTMRNLSETVLDCRSSENTDYIPMLNQLPI